MKKLLSLLLTAALVMSMLIGTMVMAVGRDDTTTKTTPLSVGNTTGERTDCDAMYSYLADKDEIDVVSLGTLGDLSLFHGSVGGSATVLTTERIGNYEITSGAAYAPYSIGVFAVKNGTVYTLTQAYDAGLITDMELLAQLLINNGKKFYMVKNVEGETTVCYPTSTPATTAIATDHTTTSTTAVASSTEVTSTQVTQQPTTQKEYEIVADPDVAFKKIILNAGTSKALTIKGASSQRLYWSTTNKRVVKVDKNGKVTAVKRGSAYVHASDNKGLRAVFEIKVKQPAKRIVLSVKNKTIKIGKRFKIKGTIKPNNANDKCIKWQRSNKKVVLSKVKTKSGEYVAITAKRVGKAKITAKPNDGSKVSAVCNITIRRG